MSQLNDVLTAIDTETTAVAAEVDALRASLANVITPDQLAKLASISSRLQGIAADPANPVPAAPPADATTPPAA